MQDSKDPLITVIGGGRAGSLGPATEAPHTQRTQCEGSPVNIILVIINAAELALAAIILFYVIEMLTMPANMKRV